MTSDRGSVQVRQTSWSRRNITLVHFDMDAAVEEVILTYLLGLHLAPIRPTGCIVRHEAAFQLFEGAELAGVKGVWLTELTLRHASIALLSCLVNCEETKNIVTHLKCIIWHFLCEELAWRFWVPGPCSDVLPLRFCDSAAFPAAFLVL